MLINASPENGVCSIICRLCSQSCFPFPIFHLRCYSCCYSCYMYYCLYLLCWCRSESSRSFCFHKIVVFFNKIIVITWRCNANPSFKLTLPMFCTLKTRCESSALQISEWIIEYKASQSFAIITVYFMMLLLCWWHNNSIRTNTVKRFRRELTSSPQASQINFYFFGDMSPSPEAHLFGMFSD